MSNSNLMNHVLMNKLDDELSKAIEEVGGDISQAKGPWDYPAIIKDQLEAKGMSADLKAGPGIVIRDFHGQKFICATSGALTTGALNPPAGSYKQPVSEVIEAGTPIQEVFEALFYKILPKMSSLYKGDIIRSQEDGSDRYNEEDTRTGLIPNSMYLRLYVANRQEPIYVLLSGHGLVNAEGELGSEPSIPGATVSYNGGESEYISVSVKDNIITATLKEKGVELLNKVLEIEREVVVLKDNVTSLESNQSDIESNITSLTTELNVIKDAANSTSDAIDVISSKIGLIESDLNDKVNVSSFNDLKDNVDNTTEVIDDLSSKVSETERVVIEVQQASVTKEQVNNIVAQEVNHVVNNTELVDGKVKEQLIEALANGDDEEVQNALNAAVDKVMSDNSVTDGSSIVDDIFSGL